MTQQEACRYGVRKRNSRKRGNENLKVVRDFVRPDSGRPTSIALGLFDGVHIGHREVLGKALQNRELCPCVFTYTISDSVPHIKKMYMTLTSDEQKCSILERMGFELVVMPDFEVFKDLEPEEFVEEMLIRRMGAKELSCGYDFTFGKMGKGNTAALERIAAKHGVKVNIVSPISLDGEAVSSTRIRQAILEGQMDRASRMLGRRFSIRLRVEHGNQIGRLMDFPTINQVFPRYHIVPRYGVYSTVVNIDGKLYGGVTNVGVKPTVGSDGPLAETYIIDFQGDLYGKTVEVYFFRFVRPETKFASIDQLKAQIARDKESVTQEVAANIEQMLFHDGHPEDVRGEEPHEKI